MKINEATSTDLKIIKELEKLGWKIGDTLLYQQEYQLSAEQQREFDGKKSVKPDIVLTERNRTAASRITNRRNQRAAAVTISGADNNCGRTALQGI